METATSMQGSKVRDGTVCISGEHGIGSHSWACRMQVIMIELLCAG